MTHIPADTEKLRTLGAGLADWVGDLVRARVIEHEVVERRVHYPRQFGDLVRKHATGPEGRLVAAKLRVTGTRRPGEQMTAPPGASVLLELREAHEAGTVSEDLLSAFMVGFLRRWRQAHRAGVQD